MQNKPKTLTLTVCHEFKASHSLEGFELPHCHLWKLSAEITASHPSQNDKLIDLIELQKALNEISLPLQNQYLNEKFSFAPTSENMAEWFWEAIQKKLPTAPLTAVTVTLCNLEGIATGSAHLAL